MVIYITQVEYKKALKLRYETHLTSSDVSLLFELTKRLVDPNVRKPNCCKGSVGELKQKLYPFLDKHEDEIKQYFNMI